MDIYRRYGPALLRKCERLLCSRQDSEDIVQGLFVDLLNDGKTEVSLPYLYRAATNRCLNHLKYGDNRRRLLLHHAPVLRGSVRSACDEQVIGVDLLLKLSRQLDRKTAEVLVYRFFDDMQLAEIAQLMGTSSRMVSKRLARIRARVSQLVQDAIPTEARAPARGEQ